MEIKNVGVVGCGIMGSGIAQVCAQSGYNITISEISDEVLNKGLKSIETILTRSVDKGRISRQDRESVLALIKGTTNMEDFSDCELVIEAATEDLDIKKGIFSTLDKVCPRHTILATNTSVLSVSDMAAVTGRPEKVIGIHFSNPVPVMKIVEMIKTIVTSESTVEISKQFCESLGKTVVITKDLPGFISGRIFTPFVLNAIRLVEADIAKPEDIDTIFRLGAGHPMGPLETADLVGIDIIYNAASAIYDELKDPQYLPPQLMKKMVTMGWLGRKTGKGFYTYPEGKS
ncbi:MAG TPA: 3-hydroxyacyl-CoA dehydrogenase family protein [Dehalococcoidia bacterium]|nr:3-hydroxyacyl-CoA dehydrogenase family protein [Dehalococcoidia bacterium]